MNESNGLIPKILLLASSTLILPTLGVSLRISGGIPLSSQVVLIRETVSGVAELSP